MKKSLPILQPLQLTLFVKPEDQDHLPPWFQKYKNVRYFASMFVDQVKFSFKRKMLSGLAAGIVVLMLLSGCTQNKKPPGVLSEGEMVNVLSEIYLAEERIARIGVSHDSAVKLFPQFEAKILKKTGVSDSVFRTSLEYYKANPEKLEHIYTALVDSLNLKAEKKSLSDTTKRKNVLSQ